MIQYDIASYYVMLHYGIYSKLIKIESLITTAFVYQKVPAPKTLTSLKILTSSNLLQLRFSVQACQVHEYQTTHH